jgi:hypothetical protein
LGADEDGLGDGMLLKNMKINRQLQLGLGLILLFVVLLGGMAWSLTGRLWHNTSELYDHPLTVRRAIADFEADVLWIDLAMNDLSQAGSEAEILARQQDIAVRQEHASEQIDIFYQQYLGPRGDVDRVNQAFTEWLVVLDDNIRLAWEGQGDEVIQFAISTGSYGGQV